MRLKNVRLSLSQLVAGRRNPRMVKPDRDAHTRLVASIRTFGFFSSLVVRPTENAEQYAVVAGKRRLAALREVHGDAEVQVSCVVVTDDEQVREAVALAENFAREPMHPLDEAEAFSRLASVDGKGPAAIAADFGVTEHYVRQRMKLSSLAPVVKAAYRASQIDTGTAEAFSIVPEDRQEKVWEELGGQPRHAQHVRDVIAHDWIEATHALFDLPTLPEGSVSKDLFGDSVFVERSAFLEAQSAALIKEKGALIEDGWANVVIGPRETIYGEMSALAYAERDVDAKTARRLEKLGEQKAKLEAAVVEEGDDEAIARIEAEIRAVHEAEQEIIDNEKLIYPEATKAVGTVFLGLSADGSVERYYRVPRARSGGDGVNAGTDGVSEPVAPPTSADLADRQRSAVFTHHTLAVREALYGDDAARKRVLALLLHDNVRSEALAVRPDANGVTLHATMTQGFASPAFDRLGAKRKKLDPLADLPYVTDEQAYQRISELSKAKLDGLIDLLIVDLLTCHALRPTPLMQVLGGELKVEFRKSWRPDAAWLSAFRKAQLSHLLAELYGPIYDPTHETRKKSELVEVVAKLFADAAEGKLEDAKLAGRVNAWLPSCLTEAARE